MDLSPCKCYLFVDVIELGAYFFPDTVYLYSHVCVYVCMHVYIYVYAYSHACRKRFVPLPATCRPPLSLLPPLCQLLFTLCALYIFFRAFFFLASLHVFAFILAL